MKMRLPMLGKRGQFLAGIQNMVMLVILVIVVVIGAVVIQSVKNQQASGTFADNISGNGLTSLQTGSTLFSPLATVAVAVIVLALLVGVISFFSFKRK